MSVIHPIMKRFNTTKPESLWYDLQRAKRETQEIGTKVWKIQGKKVSRKDRKDEKSCVFPQRGEWERERKEGGREREALQPISGAITGGNGSHLSHLDIWEDLWLHRREGQAEVSEERVLHRGLWHGSDDTPLLQQWEVKGKNNRAQGERGRCGTAGPARILSFLNTLSPPRSIVTYSYPVAPMGHSGRYTPCRERGSNGLLYLNLLHNEDSKTYDPEFSSQCINMYINALQALKQASRQGCN